MLAKLYGFLQENPSLPLALAFGGIYAAYYLCSVVKVRHGLIDSSCRTQFVCFCSSMYIFLKLSVLLVNLFSHDASFQMPVWGVYTNIFARVLGTWVGGWGTGDREGGMEGSVQHIMHY